MSPATAKPELTDRQIIARVWCDYLSRRKLAFFVSIVCAALAAAMAGAITLLLSPAVDGLDGVLEEAANSISHDLWRLAGGTTYGLALALVAVAVIRSIFQVAQGMLVNRMGHGLVGDVQKGLFSRMVRSDLARLRADHSGSFVASVLYDATLIREAATNGVINYAQQSATVLFLLAAMLLQDWMLTLGLMLVAPVLMTLVKRFNKRTLKAVRGTMSETGALSSAIMEGLDGVRVVKIDNREAYEESRVDAVIDRRQSHIIKGADAKAQLAPATDVLGIVLAAVALSYAAWRTGRSEMTAGDFTAFLLALTMAGNALRQIANLQASMVEGLAATRRLFAALDVEPEVRERPGAKPLESSPAKLAFEQVGFAYGDAPVLSGLDLEVRRGETIALVGPSGGGKSTALNLVPRFYDVSSGAVTLDGRDVRDIALSDLRSHIALVTQEPFLFDDTIAANIGYSRPEASRAQIEAAAAQAAAHEFISALPEGYETRVGEGGARLSGGQRQRIAIARAFLKDAPVLLLDEATSALDAESEAQVQAALERLMQGRATVVIAHRLSTVRHADRIYVLDGGRVIETGSHGELMAQKGLYARLAKGQNLEPST